MVQLSNFKRNNVFVFIFNSIFLFINFGFSMLNLGFMFSFCFYYVKSNSIFQSDKIPFSFLLGFFFNYVFISFQILLLPCFPQFFSLNSILHLLDGYFKCDSFLYNFEGNTKSRMLRTSVEIFTLGRIIELEFQGVFLIFHLQIFVL